MVDGSSHIYAVGRTWSTDFPTTPNAYQANRVDDRLDAYVIKFDPNLSKVEYSTYMPGHSWFSSVCMDEQGCLYVAGSADPSSGFPTTPGALDRSHNGIRDTVIVKFTKDLTDLEYSTYVGGSEVESSISIDVDVLGRVFFVFCTRSTDLPTTPDAFDHNHTEPAGPEKRKHVGARSWVILRRIRSQATSRTAGRAPPRPRLPQTRRHHSGPPQGSDYLGRCDDRGKPPWEPDWRRSGAPEGMVVKIRFTEFDTEAKTDLVYFFNGSGTHEDIMAIFSGPDIPPELITWSNQVLVWFVTDSQNQHGGWKAEIQFQPAEN